MIAITIPKTHYSTVSYARMMAVDMPFADGNRGTPFNERNAPAVALVGAYMSVSAGAAMAFATGATLSGMILGGMMIAGGVLSGLGAITGNETMSQIGGGLSMVGGIGSAFFNSATGAFANPFVDGNYGNSLAAQGAAGVKKAFGFDNTQVVDGVANTGEEVVSAAKDVATTNGTALTADIAKAEGMTHLDGNALTFGGKIKDSLGGLLSSTDIVGKKDMLQAASGMSDAYSNYQDNKAKKPYYEASANAANANANATNAQTALLQQRSANMQNQNAPIAGVNPNSTVFADSQAPQQKIAVTVNGQTQLVTQAEYDAIRSQQNQGLLQGAVA